MGHVLAYATPGELFRAEMRVLFWVAAGLVGLSIVLFLWVGVVFQGAARPTWLVGSYLLDWILVWSLYLSTWYYWAIDRRLWRGAVPVSRYDDFRLAGFLLAVATLTGVTLQHAARARSRPAWVWGVYGTAGLGAFLLWGAGIWPFR